MDTNLSKASRTEKIWITLMKAGARTGCHQLRERSFFLGASQFPLCARCTGILAGQVAALLSYAACSGASVFSIFAYAAVAITALGIDGIGQLRGFWVSNNLRRLLTGLFCGFFTTALFFRLVTLMLKKLLNFRP